MFKTKKQPDPLCLIETDLYKECLLIFTISSIFCLKKGSSLPLTLINFEQGSTVDLTPFHAFL